MLWHQCCTTQGILIKKSNFALKEEKIVQCTKIINFQNIVYSLRISNNLFTGTQTQTASTKGSAVQ